jgi:hypothetical protein
MGMRIEAGFSGRWWVLGDLRMACCWVGKKDA